MFRLCFVDHHGRQVWRNARDENERRRIVSRESRFGGECVLIVECEGADGICRGDDMWVSRPAGGKASGVVGGVGGVGCNGDGNCENVTATGQDANTSSSR